jgi:subtilisin family serine protease
MRRFVPLALSVVVLAACQDGDPSFSPTGSLSPSASLQSLNLSAGPERVVPGEVIVKLRDGADPAAVGRAHGLALGRLGYRGAFAVLRGAVGNEHAAAAALRGDSRVVYAEPNFLRQTTSIDPRLWAFYNPGGLTMTFTRGGSRGQPVTSETSVNDADEDNIEGYAAGGGDVLIGSIDTGVDFGHQEFLTGQLIAGRDWYGNDDDPTDEDGHGTHTTGTMVGRTVGVAGVSGAGPHVKVYVQRVCGARGCPTTAIVNAIRAAADAGVVAMNLSLGGASESQAEKDAIAYATGKGALVIASAGNDGTSTVECPACDPNAISVAALNWSSTLAYYSNWGSGLDISAPGGQMYSNTSEEQGIYSSVPGGYAYLQGTSMAAPQVTGTAAIVASTLGLRGSQLRSRILSTADGLGSTSQYGAGRLNSYRAVTGSTLTESGGDSGGGGSGGGSCHGGPKHCS